MKNFFRITTTLASRINNANKVTVGFNNATAVYGAVGLVPVGNINRQKTMLNNNLLNSSTYFTDNYWIRSFCLSLVYYFRNFNFWKLLLGFIQFRILLILLSLTLNYLFDICNLTDIKPMYLILIFMGLWIINSMYKSYKISIDNVILYIVTLVLNLLIIFITLTVVYYLLYWLDIYVNDNPILISYLGGFVLKYALYMDPFNDFYWEDYNQFFSQDSVGEVGGGGGPQFPQGYPFFDQSTEYNPVQHDSNIYPPVASTEESLDENSNDNFSNKLKFIMGKLIGIDIFKEIVKGNGVGKLCAVSKWIPMDQGPSSLAASVNKPTVELLLDKEFNGVNYKWFKIDGVKSVFVKETNLTSEGVRFEFKSKGEIDSAIASRDTGSFENDADRTLPQTYQFSHSTEGEDRLIYVQRAGYFEVGNTKLDFTLSIAEREGYYNILYQKFLNPSLPVSGEKINDINQIIKTLVVEHNSDPSRNLVHVGNNQLPRYYYRGYSQVIVSTKNLDILKDLFNKYLDVEFPSLKKDFSLKEKGLMYNKLFYELSLKGNHGEHLIHLFKDSRDDHLVAKNFIKNIGSIILESDNDQLKSKWKNLIQTPEATYLSKETLSEIRSVIYHIEN